MKESAFSLTVVDGGREPVFRKALEEAINRGTVTVSPNHFCLTGLAVYGMAKENCEVCREE